jgi:hypothetical protein
MADPNDKEQIKDSKVELENFNDSLRESISLSRVLSDNIQSFAKKLGGVNVEDRKLIDNTKQLNKAISSTLSLTDKLNAGKLKQADIDKQITELSSLKNKYFEEALDKNSRINQAYQLQDKLQKEIAEKEQTQINLLGQAEDLYTKRNEQLRINQESLEREEAARRRGQHNLISVEKQIQKAAKEQIANLNYQVAEQERIVNNNEKILSQKKGEKETTDRIVDSFTELKNLIEKQIKDSYTLSDNLKQQKSTLEETKNEWKDIGSKISSSVKSTLSLTAIFNYLKKIALDASDQVTKLQKGLVLSRDEAYAVRQEFNGMAVESGNVAINTNRVIEANAKLGEQLGFNSKFTDDLNGQFVILTKQIGLSEEAAGGLAKLSIASGKTLKESKNIAFETVQSLSSQYGIQLNQREVLEEVGKISGQTLAMFKGSVPALTQAVAQAKLLGTTLDNTKKQASALLDFETSIENELQAELLTGQQLNLERARTAALMGDMTTVMQELSNQNIDFNKFSNMNVIAQDKIAAALGTTSDELSNQLLKQQYLGKSQEEVAALAGEEVAKRLEALNAQDRFNLAMEKMQDIVARIVGGPLGQLADLIATMASNSNVLYGVLAAITALSLTKTVLGFMALRAQITGTAIAGAATSAFLNPAALLIGAAALGGIVALITTAVGNADNATEFANGGLVYGKTNAIVGEYSGVGNNPEVIAPLSDLQDIISNSNRQNVVTQDNSEMINILTSMRDEMRGTRENTGKFADKKLVASVDIQRLGTGQMIDQTLLA